MKALMVGRRIFEVYGWAHDILTVCFDMSFSPTVFEAIPNLFGLMPSKERYVMHLPDTISFSLVLERRSPSQVRMQTLDILR